jgi:hypothetical protein
MTDGHSCLDSDTDSDTDSETGSETDSETGSETDSETGSDTDSDTRSSTLLLLPACSIKRRRRSDTANNAKGERFAPQSVAQAAPVYVHCTCTLYTCTMCTYIIARIGFGSRCSSA